MVINNTAHVKLSNVELVRTDLLERNDTKVGLAGRTGLSLATCSSIINEMVAAGEVILSDECTSSGGRPAQVYRYNPHFAHVLGVYVANEAGVNRVVYATYTSTGEPLVRTTLRPTRIGYGAVEAAVATILGQDPLIKAVGVGIPGIVHQGMIGRSDIRPLQRVPMKDRLQARFGVTATVENDMNATAYGYYQKHSRELDSLAVVIVPKGNGPGTGIIVDGQILRGHSGFAGEVHYLPENFNPLLQTTRDQSTFLRALARMLATVAALVDPQRILLTGALVTPSMMEPLITACRDIIPHEHCPELLFQEDCSEEYLEGLRLRAHESLRYQYRLITKQ
jgi:predicted NBD/HSP70 family sugar kinase